MKKVISLFVVLVSLSAISLGAVAPTAGADTFCVHPTIWYVRDTSRIGGADLTPDLAAAILAKTGKPNLAAVVSPPWRSLDQAAGLELIATASNGSGTGSGFTGTVGDAFYGLVRYFEFGDPGMTWLQEVKFAITLELYNDGLLGTPRCSWT